MNRYTIALPIFGWTGPFDVFVELSRLVEKEVGIGRGSRGMHGIRYVPPEEDAALDRRWFSLVFEATDKESAAAMVYKLVDGLRQEHLVVGEEVILIGEHKVPLQPTIRGLRWDEEDAAFHVSKEAGAIEFTLWPDGEGHVLAIVAYATGYGRLETSYPDVRKIVLERG